MIINEGRVVLGWATHAQGSDLADLFRCCYGPERWTAADFARFSDRTDRNNVCKTLTEDGGAVVLGAILYTLAEDVCRVRRVAVWPDYRRRGLGAFMLNTLIGRNSPIRRRRFEATIRADNDAGQQFLESFGFRASGVRNEVGDTLRTVVDYRFDKE